MHGGQRSFGASRWLAVEGPQSCQTTRTAPAVKTMPISSGSRRGTNALPTKPLEECRRRKNSQTHRAGRQTTAAGCAGGRTVTRPTAEKCRSSDTSSVGAPASRSRTRVRKTEMRIYRYAICRSRRIRTGCRSPSTTMAGSQRCSHPNAGGGVVTSPGYRSGLEQRCRAGVAQHHPSRGSSSGSW